MIDRLSLISRFLAIMLVCVPAPIAVAQDSALLQTEPHTLNMADGPYVDGRKAGEWRSLMVTDDGSITETKVANGEIRVPGVGNFPTFDVHLREAPAIAASIEPLAADVPLFVLADTHGEYPILIALLKAQGIVNDKLAWSFGTGHLVVTGDMLDRGPHHLEILWLFYKLEGEAVKAGGSVHVLIGNHEEMVVRGDQRYLNPRYPEIARRLGVPAYSKLLGADTVLGGWLRSRPAVLKLGDLLLLHGGISPDIIASSLSLDAINTIMRRYLDIPHTHKPVEGSDDALVMGSKGPLWYRGYFPSKDKPPAASDADVADALKQFDVSRILVGHTIVKSVRPLYGGKVIAVQVYPRLDEINAAPILEGALRLEGAWYRATAQGERVRIEFAD